MTYNSIFLKKMVANIDGRDFIIGDLHGCFEELGKLLNHVKFNPNYDRVFCTGDLIDRGPYSVECLNLLSKKWFFSVMGNHEDILLDKLNTLNSSKANNFNYSELKELKLMEKFKDDIERMPLSYEVDHLILGKFYIIHSEILPEHFQYFSNEDIGNQEYQRILKTMKKYDFSQQYVNFFEKNYNKIMPSHLKQKILWSRKIVSNFYRENKNMIDKQNFSFMIDDKLKPKVKIFCGHNVVPYPMKIGQQYYIDTGCALGYSSKEINSNLFSQFGHEFFALSMVDVTTGVCYACISSPHKRHEIMKLEHPLY